MHVYVLLYSVMTQARMVSSTSWNSNWWWRRWMLPRLIWAWRTWSKRLTRIWTTSCASERWQPDLRLYTSPGQGAPVDWVSVLLVFWSNVKNSQFLCESWSSVPRSGHISSQEYGCVQSTAATSVWGFWLWDIQCGTGLSGGRRWMMRVVCSHIARRGRD